MRAEGSLRRLAITLSAVWMTLFVALPHLLVLLTSVMSADGSQLARLPLTLESYHALWNPLYAGVFIDSLILSLWATLCCLLIGYPMAFLLSRFPGWLRGLLLFLMIVPFWTNSLIRTYALKLLMGNKGVFNEILLWAGVIDKPIRMIYTEFAVIFGLTYILLPFMVLPLMASFARLDRQLLEAARDLGANAWQRFWQIILPLTLPGIIAGCLIVLLPAMGMFYVADLLGGAKNLLLGNAIKNQFLVVRDWPMGSALSVSLIVLMLALLWVYDRANRHVRRRGGLDDENLQ